MFLKKWNYGLLYQWVPKLYQKQPPEAFLEIRQNSQENTCARASFLIKLQTWACNFIDKETLANVFSCEFCEIFRNTCVTEHLWTTASALLLINLIRWINPTTSSLFISTESKLKKKRSRRLVWRSSISTKVLVTVFEEKQLKGV